MGKGVIVVGLGNELRHDDGAGIVVARWVRDRTDRADIDVLELEGEPTALLDAWPRRATAVIVDAMRSGEGPGTIRRFDVSREPLPARLRASSTHAFGMREAIELARTLDRLPRKVVVYAVEGRRFDAGTGLSDEVRAAVAKLTAMVLDEVRELGT